MTCPTDHQEDSLQDLMTSIRQLVYPSAETVSSSHTPAPHSEAPPEITSFLHALRETYSCDEAPSSYTTHAASSAKDKTMEEFLKETLIHPLKDLVAGQEQTLRTIMLDYVKANLDGLLKQWMEQNLTALATQCIRDHLKEIQNRASGGTTCSSPKE